MENQIIGMKRSLEEFRQEETEKFESIWAKIPDRDSAYEKQQETIMSELSKA
jgi:hypothetical protein